MKKRLLLIIVIVAAIGLSVVGGLLFLPAAKTSGKASYLFIPTGQAKMESVIKTMEDSSFLSNMKVFKWWAEFNGLSEKLRPGRYEIKNGQSIFDIVRMLKNGKQAPVKLIITKWRTKQQFAAFLGRKMESDSSSFLSFMQNADSVKSLDIDTNVFMTTILPNTYEVLWNSSPSSVFQKLHAEYEKYWNEERKKIAAAKGLDAQKIYILASIVEEETNAENEKGKVASVYINRYKKGMRLQADPTVKFALGDFSLKRIYEKHLVVNSPYNTYRNTGLPPGPICIPSMSSIEAVLKAPETKYLYFVAKSDFSGQHEFSETYEQHLIYAKAFQKAQDEQQKIKKANDAIE